MYKKIVQKANSHGDSPVIQIVGDNNSCSLVLPAPRLTHSLIQELLDIVYYSANTNKTSFSLKDPAEMHQKLSFNNAKRWIEKIDNRADDYSKVDSEIKEYPDSEKIIKELYDKFINVSQRDEDGCMMVGDGDAQLDEINEELRQLIINDERYNPYKHTVEDVNAFSIALIACGVSRCKILLNPNE